MDPRKERTVEALLGAAEDLFGDRSIDEVTVDELARRAGVAVGSIYNHFGSKAGLHAAVVERALSSDREYMDRAYLSGGSPLDRLTAAAEEYLAFYLAQPDHFRMLAFPAGAGGYRAGHELAEHLASTVDEQNQRLAATLREGIAAGDLRPVDPDAAATVLWAAWNGVISLAWRPDGLRVDVEQLRALLATATDIASAGLLPRRPGG